MFIIININHYAITCNAIIIIILKHVNLKIHQINLNQKKKYVQKTKKKNTCF